MYTIGKVLFSTVVILLTVSMSSAGAQQNGNGELAPGLYTLIDHQTGQQSTFQKLDSGQLVPLQNAPVFAPVSANSPQPAQAAPKPIDPFPAHRGLGGWARRMQGALNPQVQALNNQQDVLYYNAAVNQYNARAGRQIMQPSNIPDPPTFTTPPVIIIRDQQPWIEPIRPIPKMPAARPVY
ncbi:MAG: hypothetical protein K2W95_32770 [Candidatus Obscuribacterales bacterium]|nr:hypothetical protein [Candidatus Obscuribacterales bacterium]